MQKLLNALQETDVSLHRCLTELTQRWEVLESFLKEMEMNSIEKDLLTSHKERLRKILNLLLCESEDVQNGLKFLENHMTLSSRWSQLTSDLKQRQLSEKKCNDLLTSHNVV